MASDPAAGALGAVRDVPRRSASPDAIMSSHRRPAGDLIEAVVRNMRTNLEQLRYTTIAPSRYTVYVSPGEYARLEGILPRLRAETVRALDDELARQNRRGRRRGLLGRWRRAAPPLENADARWHVEFLPDLDGDLQHEHDIIVHSELILPPEPELASGARTRRITTVHSGSPPASPDRIDDAPARRPTVYARLLFEDLKGAHLHEVVRESTTIGRGGTMFPVDVRIAANDNVSREHARIRLDRATGACFLIDLSTHGTTIDGRAIERGYDLEGGAKRENGAESRLPPRARIGLADTVFVEFEKL
ncbi:MAG TPA: FhaA domain-containing protein [Vicinamibacterales bacterium]|nr:FhaA domain-containing protein [Vicinamibacterales bacterium]